MSIPVTPTDREAGIIEIKRLILGYGCDEARADGFARQAEAKAYAAYSSDKTAWMAYMKEKVKALFAVAQSRRQREQAAIEMQCQPLGANAAGPSNAFGPPHAGQQEEARLMTEFKNLQTWAHVNILQDTHQLLHLYQTKGQRRQDGKVQKNIAILEETIRMIHAQDLASACGHRSVKDVITRFQQVVGFVKATIVKLREVEKKVMQQPTIPMDRGASQPATATGADHPISNSIAAGFTNDLQPAGIVCEVNAGHLSTRPTDCLLEQLQKLEGIPLECVSVACGAQQLIATASKTLLPLPTLAALAPAYNMDLGKTGSFSWGEYSITRRRNLRLHPSMST